MSLHQQAELKKAVLDLSPKEKDKLLIRLIGKDKMLMKQLHFQLLEDESDLAYRIDNLRAHLNHLFDTSSNEVRNAANVNYFLGLNKLIKQCSGAVNEHEKVTKDKMSELEFRILILLESIVRYPRLFEHSHLLSSQKLLKYVAARIKHALGKYRKLHEDLQFEFREDLQKIIDFSYASALLPYVTALQISKEI